MPRNLKRAAAVLVLLAGFLLMGAGPARAATGGTVTVDGTTLWYTAEPGAANRVEISYEPSLNLYHVEDLVTTIKAVGQGCVQETEARVACDATGVTAVEADAGDMFDMLGVRGTLSAGVVAVELHGGPGDDLLYGGSANDKLYGGGGNDVLNGFGGDDTIYGGAGDDSMHGGGGIDTVSYAGEWLPVTADADGVFGDDGPFGQSDTIMPDIEKIVGGNGNDSLFGSPGNDGLAGGPGDDRLVGGPGDDLLDGGDGYDTLYGDGVGQGSADGTDLCVTGPGGGLTHGCEVVR